MAEDFETTVRALEATGNFRVLRRLTPTMVFNEPGDSRKYVGIVLDTETTGLDPAKAEVIELGMVKFEHGQDGTVYRVTGIFNQLRQPCSPIPEEITALTGITDADVEGRSIASVDVEEFVSDAAVIIA